MLHGSLYRKLLSEILFDLSKASKTYSAVTRLFDYIAYIA
jgi:hypothetical protein